MEHSQVREYLGNWEVKKAGRDKLRSYDVGKAEVGKWIWEIGETYKAWANDENPNVC